MTRNKRSWLERYGMPCKLGTVPHVVRVHGNDLPKLSPGNWIRIMECEGDKWHEVLVEEVHPDGYFKASR